jgi:dihydrofolate reductase
LYAQTLPIASRMYLTLVHERFDGDVCFPGYPEQDWRETSRERHEADERNPHAYSFVELERR